MPEFHPSPEVLLVGAGPAGLVLALALARRGVHVEIFDKGTAQSPVLRAVAIQAGTLELVQRVLGRPTADKIVAAGRTLTKIVAHQRDREVTLELATLPSPFPFILSLEQGKLERLLTEELKAAGVTVRRGWELKDFTHDEGSVSCEVFGPGGERIRTGASFLVGCDGAHSFVRSYLNIPFRGRAAPHEYFVGDLDLSCAALSEDAHHLYFSAAGLAAIFPLPGQRHHRALLVPTRDPTLKRAPATNFFDLAGRLLPETVRVGNPYAIAHLHFHERISLRLRAGRIFLAGDSAHVNNPAGGQGMNLGIHDALSLAPQLSKALRNEGLALLENYESERLRAARSVRVLTRMLMAGAELSDSFFFRHFLWPAMERKPAQRYFLSRISQLRLARSVQSGSVSA